MSKLGYRISIWCGVAGLALFGLGIWPIAQFVPPVAPSESAAGVAAIYAENSFRIQIGAMIAIFGAALLAPFFGAFAAMLKQIEGRAAPLTISFAISAAGVVTFFVLGLLLLTATGFRPERAPELTQLLNDLAWLVIVTPAAPADIMLVCAGLAVLCDKSPQPLLPRWTGYLCFWLATLLIPGVLAILFKTGPLAWNGVLSFYIPFGFFGLWQIGMTIVMLKALDRAET